MTWEEVIIEIRSKSEFSQLVEDAYLGADLKDNVLRFENSHEFSETIKLFEEVGVKKGGAILDIGAGNGIAAISFARKGYQVTALEPDPSDTIGAGAIGRLVEEFNLGNVKIIDSTAEDIQDIKPEFDVVYIRQAVHHANDLKQFVQNAVSSLKSGGLYLALRDHVIFDEADKKWFLESHPLHKYYGGENAFLLDEYLQAMKEAGLKNIRYYNYYESALNYAPLSTESIREKEKKREEMIESSLKRKIGFMSGIGFIRRAYASYVNKKLGSALDEKSVPGRPYTFMGIKS